MCVVFEASKPIVALETGELIDNDAHRGLTFSPETWCGLMTGFTLVTPVLAFCSAFSPSNLSAKEEDNFLYASAVLIKTVSPPTSEHSSMYRNTSPGGCGLALLYVCHDIEVLRGA